MVDRKLIEQLDSTEPEKRKAAIQQLARSKDMQAIRYLEAVERLDSESSVREIARKAVAFIKKNNEGVVPDAPAAPETPKAAPKSKYAAGSIMAEYASKVPDPDEEAPPFALTEQPVMVEVTEGRRRNAKSALDMAGRATFEEQNGKAAKYLVEAFKLNPNLKHDAYAVGLAATVTGLYKTDAVKAIVDGSALELFDKKELTGKPPKPKKDDLDAEEVLPPATWGTAMLDLLLYGIINSVIVGVTVILLINIVISAVQSDPQLQMALSMSGTPASAIIDALSQIAIVLILVYALLYGFFSIVGLLITSFFIHVAARFLLAGEGTMANLIHRTALFLGIMTALVAVAQLAGFFLPVISDPVLGIGIWAAAFGFSIWTLIGYSSRVGKAYDMGGGKGCAAIFLSTVFLVIVGAVCFALIGQAMIAQLNSTIMLQGTQGPSFFIVTPTIVP